MPPGAIAPPAPMAPAEAGWPPLASVAPGCIPFWEPFIWPEFENKVHISAHYSFDIIDHLPSLIIRETYPTNAFDPVRQMLTLASAWKNPKRNPNTILPTLGALILGRSDDDKRVDDFALSINHLSTNGVDPEIRLRFSSFNHRSLERRSSLRGAFLASLLRL